MPKLDKTGMAPAATGPLPKDQVEAWREEMLQEIARMAPPLPAGSVASKFAQPSAGVGMPPPPPLPRPELRDITAPPRVLGPLEEIKSITLVDFHRLDASPVEALNKIRAKIELIGEASVGKRLEAVRAWQSSPLYQLYLKLGRVSIEQGKNVSQVVAEFEAAGQPTLSEAEFEAIADFNSKIRF